MRSGPKQLAGKALGSQLSRNSLITATIQVCRLDLDLDVDVDGLFRGKTSIYNICRISPYVCRSKSTSRSMSGSRNGEFNLATSFATETSQGLRP